MNEEDNVLYFSDDVGDSFVYGSCDVEHREREGLRTTSIESIFDVVDTILNTRSRRHITGGVLISMSMLFGGLACTVMTIKE